MNLGKKEKGILGREREKKMNFFYTFTSML